MIENQQEIKFLQFNYKGNYYMIRGLFLFRWYGNKSEWVQVDSDDECYSEIIALLGANTCCEEVQE